MPKGYEIFTSLQLSGQLGRAATVADTSTPIQMTSASIICDEPNKSPRPDKSTLDEGKHH